jgi:hypothetical protein
MQIACGHLVLYALHSVHAMHSQLLTDDTLAAADCDHCA